MTTEVKLKFRVGDQVKHTVYNLIGKVIERKYADWGTGSTKTYLVRYAPDFEATAKEDELEREQE